MTRPSESNVSTAVGSRKKSGSGTSIALPPCRSVIRIWRFTTWTTWSGPTATHGSGGSTLVDGPVVRASPSKPVCAAGPSAFRVAWVGSGATTDTEPGAAGAVPLPVVPRPRFGSRPTGRLVGAFRASARASTEPR